MAVNKDNCVNKS